MTGKMALINACGLRQIRAALNEHHRQIRFTDEMISAWASDAELSYAEGNGCAFEIPAKDSLSLQPVTVVITKAGFDVTSQAQ